MNSSALDGQEVSLEDDWIEMEVDISEIENLLNEHDVEVTSPDGWVNVSNFIDKGVWQEYILESNGKTIKCNENHLFQTPDGWKFAKDLTDDFLVLHDDGEFHLAKCYATGNEIPIVDITVDSEEHRYYTNGVSSHNTHVGKTMAMCHLASSYLMNGLDVLYITLEISEEEIAKRIDANLLNIPIGELETIDRSMFDSKIERLKRKNHGKLIIKEYPNGAAGYLQFKALMKELFLKKKFKPKIVVIDYLNICCSSKVKLGGSINSYQYVKNIAEELRAFAIEEDVCVISATQTNRVGFTNSDPDLTNTSESFGLPMTADFMAALITDENLEKLGQILVKQLKNRYNGTSYYTKFVVGVDRSRQRLYNVEQSAQEDISDSGQDEPVMDRTEFVQQDTERTKFSKFKF
jgi:hypothetical protein